MSNNKTITKSWNKPELVRLGIMKDVAANKGAANDGTGGSNVKS